MLNLSMSLKEIRSNIKLDQRIHFFYKDKPISHDLELSYHLKDIV